MMSESMNISLVVWENTEWFGIKFAKVRINSTFDLT